MTVVGYDINLLGSVRLRNVWNIVTKGILSLAIIWALTGARYTCYIVYLVFCGRRWLQLRTRTFNLRNSFFFI